MISGALQIDLSSGHVATRVLQSKQIASISWSHGIGDRIFMGSPWDDGILVCPDPTKRAEAFGFRLRLTQGLLGVSPRFKFMDSGAVTVGELMEASRLLLGEHEVHRSAFREALAEVIDEVCLEEVQKKATSSHRHRHRHKHRHRQTQTMTRTQTH